MPKGTRSSLFKFDLLDFVYCSEEEILPVELPKQSFIKNGLRSNYYKKTEETNSKPTRFVRQHFFSQINRSNIFTGLVLNVVVGNHLVLYHRFTLDYSNPMEKNRLTSIIVFHWTSIGMVNKIPTMKVHRQRRPIRIKRRNPPNPNRDNLYPTKKSLEIFIPIKLNRAFSPRTVAKTHPFAIVNHRLHAKIMYA